jgi:hypothetical protein
MKKLIDMNTISKLFTGAGILVLLLAGAACKKTNNPGGPSIASFRTLGTTDTANVTIPYKVDSTAKIVDSNFKQVFVVPQDSMVVSGQLGHQYAILGNNLNTLKTITINGVSNPILPGLVTKTSAIFAVASNIPFGSTGPGNFVITTEFGTTSTSFPIQQPPPVITSIDPQVGNAGDTMTITGTLFNGATRVTFDSTQATIISQSLTTIKVIVPVGVVQAFVYVFTPGGAGKSPQPYGFKSIIYVNGLQNSWGSYTGYNSILDFNNHSNLITGESSNISVNYQAPYGALQIGYGGPALNPTALGLTSIKFSIYGGSTWPVGGKVQVVINGDYPQALQEVVVPGQWTTYSIPLSQWGNQSPIKEFVIQGANVATGAIVYVTDIGFI